MQHDAESATAECFRLGEWRVYPGLNRIEGSDGEARQLEPKVMRVLAHLASRPGEVFGQEDLIDAVWGGVAVSPNVLTYSIAALRKALGDDWRAPRYIETISKSGYRLVERVAAAERVPLALTASGGAAVEHPDTAGSPAATIGHEHDTPGETVGATGRDGRGKTGVGGSALAAVLVVVVVLLALSSWFGPDSPSPARGAVLQPRPVTALPGVEVNPTLSPDGNHLAFAWRPEGADNYDLYVKLIGAESPALLVGSPKEDLNPAWTPDGLQIVYVARGEGDDCGIFRIPATGGSSRRLADCPGRPIGNLSLSPDGTQVAVGSAVAPGEPTRVLVLDLGSGAVRTLAPPPATAQGDYYPRFSPDGSRVSFLRIRGDGLSDLFVVDAQGGEPLRVTFDNRDIGGQDWTADGEHLVFSSYRTGQFRLWRVPATGGEPAPVAIADHQMTSLSLSREGDRLVYYRDVNETSLLSAALSVDSAQRIALESPDLDREWAADSEEELLRRLRPDAPSAALSSTRWEAHPALSSDGRRAAFASDRSGFFEIWSAALDGSEAIRHTSFEGPFVGSPRFSPGDDRIVFDARPEGHADLWVADAAGSGAERLTDAPGDEFAASFSLDGNWIYFTSDRSGAWEIWRMRASGGEPVQVTRAGGYAAQEAHDGSLYFTKPGEPGIWRASIDPEGRAVDERPAVPGLPLIDWGSWTVGRRGVYFVARGPDLIMLWDPLADRSVPLLSLSGSAPRQHPSLAVSADETLVLWAQIDRSETDIMLVEGFR